MRATHVASAFLTLVCASQLAAAQTQPTIPVVVAQASFGSEMFGVTKYFDGRLPPGWPNNLVPPGAKVLGGGVSGETSPFQVQTAVFAFPSQANPNDVLRSLILAAGYMRHELESPRSAGGFVGSGPPTLGDSYCKGASMVSFKAVDSVQSPLVMAIHLVDGEVARQNCEPHPDWPSRQRFPVTIPTLTPPRGVVSFGGGSSWGGDEGTIQSTLRTTLAPDSILAHYTPQLIAGGWKAEGKPVFGDGIAVQRFSLMNGKDPWTAAMIVMAMGEKRDVRLQLMKGDGR
jgi:hypothetical protein